MTPREEVGTQTTKVEAGAGASAQVDEQGELAKLRNRVNLLEAEKNETFEVLSKACEKMDGLEQEDLMKYADFLKMQLNKLTVQSIDDFEEIESKCLEQTDMVELQKKLADNVSQGGSDFSKR